MRRFLLIVALLVTPACCVTSEEHKTLTEAFDAYVQRTEPLVQAEIASIGTATEADAALANMTQGWLDDAKNAVKQHRIRAGLDPAPVPE